MKTKSKVSRQRRWQIRQREKGLCILCGLPAVTNSYCLKHAIQARERARRAQGCKRRFRSLTYRLAEMEKSRRKRRAASASMTGRRAGVAASGARKGSRPAVSAA